MSALLDLKGKTFRSDSLGPLFAVLDAAFTDCEADRFLAAAVSEKTKPLLFTGLFVHAITNDKVLAEGGVFTTTKEVVIDVFGHVGKTPVVVRIENWRPNFLVLVPTGMDVDLFRQTIIAAASSGKKGQGTTGGTHCEVVEMPGFESFEFGLHRTYLRFSSMSAQGAQAMKEAAFHVFSEAWSNIDALLRGVDQRDIEMAGCRRLTSKIEITLHADERGHFPLRFTDSLTEQSMPYHFMTQEDVPLVGHLSLTNYELFDPAAEGIRYKYGVRIKYVPGSVKKAAEGGDSYFREVLVMSYDIETLLSRVVGHKFSDPRVQEDEVMTVGMPIYRVGKNIPEVSLALVPRHHTSSPLPNATIIHCEDERDIIHIFALFLRRYHISILTGFNIDIFDTRYMYMRAETYTPMEEELVDAFSEYDGGRGGVRFSASERFKMDSGYKEGLHRPISSQRSTIDAYLRLAKLRPKEFQEGESLNKMLEWFGVKDPETRKDARKDDLAIADMYELWRKNEPDGIATVVKYCVQDACRTYLLLYWINFFVEMFELANTSFTTLLDSFHRADGMRVSQQLSRYAREGGFAFCDELPPHDYRRKKIDGKIGGGDVKSLQPGLQQFIISLDYKSEYPAQKEAFNIGSSSKVQVKMLTDPSAYGLVVLHADTIVDQYCSADPRWRTRERYWITSEGNIPRLHSLIAVVRAEADKGTTVLPLVGAAKEMAIFSEALRRATREMWVYEVQQFWAEATDGGKPIQWKTYFVQSPRDDKGSIIHHYSVQAKFLTGLRFERDRMKGCMAKAGAKASALESELKSKKAGPTPPTEEEERTYEVAISKFKADVSGFNSRQNATKTGMNSEYGTGNNDTSAHFDQDVAATVTWCSRRLAEFLRRVLTCPEYILPDYAVEKDHLFDLINVGRPYKTEEGKKEMSGGLKQFGYTLTEYDGPFEAAGIDGDSVCPPSDAWKHPDGYAVLDPHLIVEKRVVKKWYRLRGPTAVIVYQDTDSNYYFVRSIREHFSDISDPVKRARLTLHALLDHNALAASIVGGMVNRWPIAVDCDGGFVVAYWSPMKKQYMGVKSPMNHDEVETKVNATLLFPNLKDRRKDEAVAQFLDRKKIKITGYLVIRRETPDYVIEFIFRLLENLLCLREGVDAIKIVWTILDECNRMILEAKSDDMKKFSKQQKYRPYSNNEVRAIVERLRSEEKHDFIPTEFSVTRYVLTTTQNYASKERQATGQLEKGKKSSRMRLLTELAASTTPILLDAPYYLEKMAKALANLVFEELVSKEVERLQRLPDDSHRQSRIERMEKILVDYKESHLSDSEDSKLKAKKAIREAAMILIGRYYTVPGIAAEHKRLFRSGAELLADTSLATNVARRAVKQSLSLAFDRSTTVGALAEVIINTEASAALLRRTKLTQRMGDYIAFIRSLAKEEDRVLYISNRTVAIGRELTETHRLMIEAYAALILKLQEINPRFSSLILQHRQDGTPVTVESLCAAVPVDIRGVLCMELINLGNRVEPFRQVIVDKTALERAMAWIAEGKETPPPPASRKGGR